MSACVLPRIQRKELRPLDDEQIAAFLKEIHGDKDEALSTLTLFTGLREGEVLGLRWECVDFFRGTITVNKQLQYKHNGNGEYQLQPTKNSKSRVIVPATFIMKMLRQHRSAQLECKLRAGQAWEDSGFVFTDELGHSYAVAAIRAGDDIKTVQGNLGHATAAFTLDVYGHVTDQMKQASSARMDRYIEFVSGQ